MAANGVPALARRASVGLGLLVLVGSLVVGSDLLGARETLFGSPTPKPRASAFSRVLTPNASGRATEKTVLRSQPWWQRVGAFQGSGPTTTPMITIGSEASQWRVKWRCQTGNLIVRASATSPPVVNATCPGQQTSVATQRVNGGLQVSAEGPWTIAVDRQVDVPLEEPPLPAMTAAGTKPVASGVLYRIDQVGQGRVTIYQLSDGKYALRLSDFYVTANVDLQIRLSPLRAPRSTRQYLSSPSALAAPLDITAGSLNFVLPPGLDPHRYRSVVIWCPLVTSAYAAATINPA